MTIRAFNSIQGFSVGQNPTQEIILANGDITTVNFTANGISNLGPIGNVKITGGNSGQVIQTDGLGNLTFADASGGNSAAPMPYYIPVGESIFVPTNYQGLFTVPIEIDGELEVDGILAEVGTAINSESGQIIFDDNGELTGNSGFTFNNITGAFAVPGTGTFTGSVLPSANVQYDLGSPTQRWKDLYLSNNTIYIGSSTISADGPNLVFTNATGGELVVFGNGTTTTTSISNGNSNIEVNLTTINFSADGNANVFEITSTGANITGEFNVTGNAAVGGILTDNYYYANGQPIDTQNPSGSNTQIQYNNSNNFGASANFTFNESTNLLTVVGNANFSNVSGGNTVSANYLISNSGCVTISTGAISVSGTNAGIFNSAINDINLGLVSNVVIGSTTGQVTVRNNFYANGNVGVQNTLDAPNIKVGDLYSSRSPVNVDTNTVVDSFDKTKFRSAKYTIKAGSDFGYQALEVLLIHDNINSSITVYGSLSTAGVDLVVLTSNVNAGNVELLATALGANTVVNLMGTYVPD